MATLLYKGQQCYPGQAAQNSPRHRLQHVSRAEGPHPPAPTGPPAADGSTLADAASLQEESATRASSAVAAGASSSQAGMSEGAGAELGQNTSQVGGSEANVWCV